MLESVGYQYMVQWSEALTNCGQSSTRQMKLLKYHSRLMFTMKVLVTINRTLIAALALHFPHSLVTHYITNSVIQPQLWMQPSLSTAAIFMPIWLCFRYMYAACANTFQVYDTSEFRWVGFNVPLDIIVNLEMIFLANHLTGAKHPKLNIITAKSSVILFLLSTTNI